MLYGGNPATSKPWFPSQVLTSLAPCAVVVPFATTTLIAAWGTTGRVVVVVGRVVVVVEAGARDGTPAVKPKEDADPESPMEEGLSRER